MATRIVTQIVAAAILTAKQKQIIDHYLMGVSMRNRDDTVSTDALERKFGADPIMLSEAIVMAERDYGLTVRS